MITLFVGDDTALSRKKFIDQKNLYQENGYLTIDLSPDNLKELDRWLLEAQSFFEEKKVFFGENIVSKKEGREIFKKASEQATVDFIIWDENLDERSAKTYFKNARIFASKLPTTIFKWLDSLYPKNTKSALLMLQDLSKTVDENIIFYMLTRRIRELILIKNGLSLKKNLAEWQLGKLRQQAKLWDNDKLVKFYDALYRIELYTKTGTNYYSTKEALDILTIYSL